MILADGEATPRFEVGRAHSSLRACVCVCVEFLPRLGDFGRSLCLESKFCAEPYRGIGLLGDQGSLFFQENPRFSESSRGSFADCGAFVNCLRAGALVSCLPM